MKFLVVLFVAVGISSASAGYGHVAVAPRPPVVVVTPIEQVNIPVAPEVVEPVPFRVLPAHPVPLLHAHPVAPVPLLHAVEPLAVAAPQLPLPLAAPSSQFHAQDELGGFSFGYSNINSAKNEVRTPDGVTRGFYEYVDANNILQRVEYVADPINGFRVAGTNIPVSGSAVAPASVIPLRRKRSAGYGAPPPPVVLPAPLVHVAPVQQVVHVPAEPILLHAAPVHAPVVLPEPAFLHAAPVVAAPAVALPLEVAAPSSQFHAQDEFGGVHFGYTNINSARQETRSPDGVTRGSYSYVDGNGLTQTVHYVADALGFRVAGTNIPVVA